MELGAGHRQADADCSAGGDVRAMELSAGHRQADADCSAGRQVRGMELSAGHRQADANCHSQAGVEAFQTDCLQRLVMACKPEQLRSAALSLDHAAQCQVLITDSAGLQLCPHSRMAQHQLWHC